MSSIQKNPEETHIFAILYPAPGKLERLKELMADHINATHKNEDYTPRYLMTEQLDTKEPALHMFETYTSRDNAEKHTKTENFKTLMSKCEKEGVMGKEPYLVFTKTVGGYDWDRQKI
ncbi:hypothetical protein DOTSEDRAFT_37653 [Dothistroma septosporum NZE10]|uniref:ABM domain-containing protein n=1 Tax=Dothistroma septosporum (strain NZE10 / CBS 128990) TaxID=675120 RepID=N1PH87_DOTSN|nr:hypothetical protein DOTSEDRAFT_37653 [Dothistroma septosporum NZE10]